MITLVTDSTAYLTKEEADRLKLRVVPMHYTIAGNSYTEGFADVYKRQTHSMARSWLARWPQWSIKSRPARRSSRISSHRANRFSEVR